ncbi:uncharacterized protein FSUBG_7882 [Fusarium subglutinans]|uniref:Uncharacterized protein n=1 Tax=Gibberella subglutinans TaxID=42677 RepID=A0A8H5UWR4_GIBSU|nr:uncharacterized protein FSUBG_7882 [Fusarium subglutinans]KAF5602207.1 hypothetical protein FSUBG_7882 [Fusarium subglutinans]
MWKNDPPKIAPPRRILRKKKGPKSPPESKLGKNKPSKGPPECRLQQSIQALRIIAKQRPDDPEAQRRAQVATDLYLESWSRQKFPTPVIAHDPAESRRQTSWVPNLPNEIYYMIFDHIIGEYPTCPRSKRRREKTLLSLTCSCRLFQEILETYLYKHPRSGMFDGIPSILMFRFSLTIEPRRGPLVQSLSINVKCMSSNSIWLKIVKLCPNLSRLEIVETNRGLSRSHLEFLGKLFSDCPHVTRFSLDAGTSDSEVSKAYRTDKGFLKFWRQLTHVQGLPRSEPSDIISISKGCRSLQRLRIGSSRHLDLGSLLDASQKWGKTLRTLDLNWRTTTKATIIPQLLEQLPVVEEVYLGHLYDIWPSILALSRLSPPRLKRFKGVSHRKCDPVHSLEGETAICDMITAQGDTLESISITGQHGLHVGVLEAIKGANKLKCLDLEVGRFLTDEEREDLQAACPKLQASVKRYGEKSNEKRDFDWSYASCGSWGVIPDD